MVKIPAACSVATVPFRYELLAIEVNVTFPTSLVRDVDLESKCLELVSIGEPHSQSTKPYRFLPTGLCPCCYKPKKCFRGA